MQPVSISSPRRSRGFTLLELMLVIAIIAVLTLLSWLGYGRYVKRGESAACVTKMVNFGAALHTYVTDKQTWPQEDVLNGAGGRAPDEDVLWDWWYEQMKEYGVNHDDWYCPTDLRLREQEEKADEADGKSDSGGKLKNPSYIPAKFDFGFYKPFDAPNQPWLVERIGHDDGMNKLMPNGTVHEMLMPGMLSEAQMKELDAALGEDFDRLFLTFMIQHHKGAVSMVRELFAARGAGQDETVFKFASDVEVDQTTEINRMLEMLFALGANPPSAPRRP